MISLIDSNNVLKGRVFDCGGDLGDDISCDSGYFTALQCQDGRFAQICDYVRLETKEGAIEGLFESFAFDSNNRSCILLCIGTLEDKDSCFILVPMETLIGAKLIRTRQEMKEERNEQKKAAPLP